MDDVGGEGRGQEYQGRCEWMDEGGDEGRRERGAKGERGQAGAEKQQQQQQQAKAEASRSAAAPPRLASLRLSPNAGKQAKPGWDLQRALDAHLRGQGEASSLSPGAALRCRGPVCLARSAPAWRLRIVDGRPQACSFLVPLCRALASSLCTQLHLNGALGPLPTSRVSITQGVGWSQKARPLRLARPPA
ncbi:uncharacterized protein PSFLO_03637 [Pseudozyma flocculosa]|uniref:Uncharacterized protein n=1 Tax=Pseudozyma flocculosa TaxID=84751 RepID=A0A5C3F262_9BASI|nr:uncharacterized protein PSFLO_03637 [Pseudozyma flocculosa]